jgi:hypothetical protein
LASEVWVVTERFIDELQGKLIFDDFGVERITVAMDSTFF